MCYMLIYCQCIHFYIISCSQGRFNSIFLVCTSFQSLVISFLFLFIPLLLPVNFYIQFHLARCSNKNTPHALTFKFATALLSGVLPAPMAPRQPFTWRSSPAHRRQERRVPTVLHHCMKLPFPVFSIYWAPTVCWAVCACGIIQVRREVKEDSNGLKAVCDGSTGVPRKVPPLLCGGGGRQGQTPAVENHVLFCSPRRKCGVWHIGTILQLLGRGTWWMCYRQASLVWWSRGLAQQWVLEVLRAGGGTNTFWDHRHGLQTFHLPNFSVHLSCPGVWREQGG